MCAVFGVLFFLALVNKHRLGWLRMLKGSDKWEDDEREQVLVMICFIFAWDTMFIKFCSCSFFLSLCLLCISYVPSGAEQQNVIP